MFIAVPFEEDEQNQSIWFLDHNFHENMWAMFKKVNGIPQAISTFIIFVIYSPRLPFLVFSRLPTPCFPLPSIQGRARSDRVAA
jgi:hypothetical protein